MGRNNQQRRRARAKERHRAHRESAPSRPGGQAAGSSFGSTSGPPGPSDLDLEREASLAISRALEALAFGRIPRVTAAVADLASGCETTRGRRVVLRTIERILRDAIAQAWARGWQPVDLHRLAVRRLSPREVSLLVDAMADDMRRYADASIDPRWAAQLHELGAEVWWPRDDGYVGLREEWSAGDSTGAVRSAIDLMQLVLPLPVLEKLMSPPGAFRPTAGQALSGSGSKVDQRILNRVRALLAKAESTTFEAEAETFTAGAQALIARHSIDAALLSAGGPTEDTPQGRRIGIDNPYEAPKAGLLHAVAGANRCRIVWSRELGFCTVVGFVADLDAVELLFTSLLVQATRAMAAAGSRKDRAGRSRTRAFRNSFLTSYGARIGERLRDVTLAEVDAVETERAQDHHRGELVPLLTARSAEVDRAVEAMFPDLMNRPLGSASYDSEGWYSGRAAADAASLGPDPSRALR